jgi:hypothetical protein
VSVCPIGTIITAKLPYTQSDYRNKDIHDTHAKSTDHNWYYPDDLTMLSTGEKKYIHDQIVTVLTHAGNVIHTQIKLFPDQQNGFKVYGSDFLIDTDLHVWLLEINGRSVGYKEVNAKNNEWSKDFTEFCRQYFEWVYTEAIKWQEK